MPRSVAIVGAGLAGLSCARTLAAHGVETRLFDKGRAPGGRLATRRVEAEGRAFAFDHGAQYLTARGALFRATLDASGAQAWAQDGWHVGVPRMSAIPRALADGLEVTLAREVVALAGGPGAWMLRHASPRRPGQAMAEDTIEDIGPFGAVVLAIPAPQAVALLRGPAPHLARVVEMVRIAPCWTLMAAFPQRLALPDTLRPEASPIGWAARDSSKPGRDAASECWVVQGSPSWSREHLELRAEEAAAALLTAFAELAGGVAPPLHASAHRWRYALVEQAMGAPCLWEPALGLGAAGDWCIAARAEAAVESGAALGAVIAGR